MTNTQLGPVGVGLPSYTWGRGYTDVVRPQNPPAGSAHTHVVPSSAQEVFLTASATLTASAAVVNRYPALMLANGDGSVYATFAATVAVAAAGVATVTWALGANIPNGAGGAAPAVPLPDLIVMPGFRVILGAIGLDVADQLSGLAFTILHIPTGPTGPPQGTAPLADTAGLYGTDVTVAVDVTG
jgi:hypothetical protein